MISYDHDLTLLRRRAENAKALKESQVWQDLTTWIAHKAALSLPDFNKKYGVDEEIAFKAKAIASAAMVQVTAYPDEAIAVYEAALALQAQNEALQDPDEDINTI